MTEKEFTKEELAQFDGKEGRKAYIACDKVVYDVTENHSWKNGQHHGIKAGVDATKALQRSPHKESVLKALPVVGQYKA